MAFFRNFQQNLPSVSSLMDTISNAVDDLTTAVGEVSYALSDSVAEQVSSMINGFRPEEESSAAAEAVDTSKQGNAMSPEVSRNTNCQKTQSNMEHRANPQAYYSTSVSQRQDQGINEGRVFKHIDDRQQTLSNNQESDNLGDSLRGHVSDGKTSVTKQNARGGSTCQELGHTDRYKKIGLGISGNDKDDLKEVRYQETKENHIKKVEKHIKSKGSKGNECMGNECSPKDILASNRQMIQKKPIMKEDIHSAPSTNSRDKSHGKIKEQINPTQCYKVKGVIKTKENEAISAKERTAKSKDEKYSKIIPEKGEVS